MTRAIATATRCLCCQGCGCEECGGTGSRVTTVIERDGVTFRIRGDRELTPEGEKAMGVLMDAAVRLQERIERVHEHVGCPKCGSPVGERCIALRGRGPAGAVKRHTKHPHDERLRAAGISLR